MMVTVFPCKGSSSKLLTHHPLHTITHRNLLGQGECNANIYVETNLASSFSPFGSKCWVIHLPPIPAKRERERKVKDKTRKFPSSSS